MENITAVESNTETANSEALPAKPEGISVEEELARVASERVKHEGRLDTITAARAHTEARLAAVREKMGLPPLDETPPSLAAYDNEAEKIKIEQEALKNREQVLVSEQQKKVLIKQEQLRVLHKRTQELRNLFDEHTRASIIETGHVPGGMDIPLWLATPSREELFQWLALASRSEELTIKDLDENPLLEKPKEAVYKEAEETVTKVLEKMNEKDAITPSVLEKGISEKDVEPLIEYEGQAYTPESLIARVEEQNREAEIKEATAEAAQSYNASIQSN